MAASAIWGERQSDGKFVAFPRPRALLQTEMAEARKDKRENGR